MAIVNPGQFLLALELHALDVKALAKRFDLETLVGIQQSLSLEPETPLACLRQSRLPQTMAETGSSDGSDHSHYADPPRDKGRAQRISP